MDIIADMTRQYKSVEEQLCAKITALSNRKEDNHREKEKLD